MDRLEQSFRNSAEERAAVSSCLGVVSEMDTRLRSVSAALEARMSPASEAEQRSSMASIQEISEGLVLERASRQAQVLELRRSLAEDISIGMDAAREALRTDVAVQFKELRVGLDAHLEVLERELQRFARNCGDGDASEEGIAARVAAIEAEVNRNLAALAQPVGELVGALPGVAQQVDHPALSFGEEPANCVEAHSSSVAGQGRPLSPRRFVTSVPAGLPAAQATPQRSGSVAIPGEAPRLVTYSVARVAPLAAAPSHPAVAPVAQVLVGPTGPLVASTPSAATILKQHQSPSLTARPPPPSVTMSDTPVVASSLQGSAAGSFVPAEAATGSPSCHTPAAPDDREGFRRCLQELREENQALRAGSGQAEAGGSASFPVTGRPRAAPAPQLQVVGGPAAWGGSQSVILPGGRRVQMMPGATQRTASPIGGQWRATSPSAAVRRSMSPQR
uniref:Uncharacterized protein n=1 Tax=Alexandrium andersonii TaxID=327968 RepID=A0A7S2J1K0_9DINO|mmetsp:Transcript_92625/g.207391  ORF Transcript_92625/g.207391 Transcript_92625/m.207391 type:complete len:449 (+) Transcript_92625:1-1347(+)